MERRRSETQRHRRTSRIRTRGSRANRRVRRGAGIDGIRPRRAVGKRKTTLLREIEAQLTDWTIVWFSPWSVGDEAAISSEFVAALGEAFPQSADIGRTLASYARFGTPMLKMIPIVGDVIASVAAEGFAELAKRPAWHTEFEKLSAAIREQRERVLVLVDDVDRLDGSELRALLRVVRLLGRFTNVHYLMAYDQVTIETVLGSVNAIGDSSQFMEKIVQYPFEVPPAPMVVRRRWARQILEMVCLVERDGVYGEDLERLVAVLASGLETPRASERLKEQILSLSALLVNAEVDALDFATLTWLRIAHHRVWDDIRLNPSSYLSWRENESQETVEVRKKAVKALVVQGNAQPAWDAIAYLFEPVGIASILAGREGLIQTPRYFERYFQIGLPEDDVSERRSRAALAILEAGESTGPDVAELQLILLGQDDERSALAFDTVSRLRRESGRNSTALFNFADGVRAAMQLLDNPHLGRFGSAERWVGQEIHLALNSGLVEMDWLIDRFGYPFLTSSAFGSKRALRHEDAETKQTYLGLARMWVAQVRRETLTETLDRPELIAMTSFCIWVRDLEPYQGFLSEKVQESAEVLAVAKAFVSFNEWVGAGVHYDIVFRGEEFKFAAGEALTSFSIDQLPAVPEIPDYEVSDRLDRKLSDAQRRDFAVRSLGQLIGRQDS